MVRVNMVRIPSSSCTSARRYAYLLFGLTNGPTKIKVGLIFVDVCGRGSVLQVPCSSNCGRVYNIYSYISFEFQISCCEYLVKKYLVEKYLVEKYLVEKMASIPNTESWREFFDCMKNLPALWKVKDDIFKNREEKKKSWEKLFEVYKSIDNDATLDSLKKRVMNIKSCYRRELKKIEQSEKSGCSSDSVHTPSLWYFDHLDFLRDQERQTPGTSSMDLSEDNEFLEVGIEAREIQIPIPKRKKKSMIQHMAERNELLRAAVSNLNASHKEEASDDEAEIFAKSWAASYRKMSGVQQIYAKKAIEEILVLGQLNKLTLETVSNSMSSSSSRTSTPIFGFSPPTPGSINVPTPSSFEEQPIIVTVSSDAIEDSYSSINDLFTDQQYS